MNAAPFKPDLSLWDAWHPVEAAMHLAEADVTWYVTAGWALDLFRGEQTRDHDDLEIAVPDYGFGAVQRALAKFELFVVGGGLAQPVTSEALAAHHQTWVREPTTGMWRLDVMREPWDRDIWMCRRDRRIRLPGSKVIAHTAEGIPYAQPEIALLFKAKEARRKDEEDFAAVLPLLNAVRRRWLTEALTLVHPMHPWLQALAAT